MALAVAPWLLGWLSASSTRRMMLRLNRALWLSVLLSTASCATTRDTPSTAEERHYTNPVYSWSVAYRSDWRVDSHNPAFVTLEPQPPFGSLVRIHSESTTS